MQVGDQTKVDELMEQLREKYAAGGQNLEAYLEGLLYQDYLNYWDYIHTDTLLSLQVSRTHYPDEQIFIIYHQISELNFKMILSELKQIADMLEPSQEEILVRLQRINRYMALLVNSFDVMAQGMDPKQFMRFRLALLPASGFQSAQFRMIEIASTDVLNLIPKANQDRVNGSLGTSQLFDLLYWQYGATELGSGKKTLTLQLFEAKYAHTLQGHMEQYASNNLRQQYRKACLGQDLLEGLRQELRHFDLLMNVEWRLVHLRSASKYLHKAPGPAVPATGGTNWKEYLPPNFQSNHFFPELWSTEEKEKWGTFDLEK